jgi:hypothetical protein
LTQTTASQLYVRFRELIERTPPLRKDGRRWLRSNRIPTAAVHSTTMSTAWPTTMRWLRVQPKACEDHGPERALRTNQHGFFLWMWPVAVYCWISCNTTVSPRGLIGLRFVTTSAWMPLAIIDAVTISVLCSACPAWRAETDHWLSRPGDIASTMPDGIF